MTHQLPVMEFLEDNILSVDFRNVSRIDDEDARKMIAARKAFTGGRPVRLLMKNQSVRSLTKEARKYMRSPEAVEGVEAAAFVVKDGITKMILEFMFIGSNYSFLIKSFSREGSAINWLKKQKI